MMSRSGEPSSSPHRPPDSVRGPLHGESTTSLWACSDIQSRNSPTVHGALRGICDNTSWTRPLRVNCENTSTTSNSWPFRAAKPRPQLKPGQNEPVIQSREAKTQTN